MPREAGLTSLRANGKFLCQQHCRSKRPINLGALPKTLQMLGSDWWHPKAAPERLRPHWGRNFIRFAVRGCRYAQPLGF